MSYYSTNDATVNARIHQNTVDIIREIPITEIAENLGLELKKSGSGFVALCPFHQEKTPSFHLTNGKGFKCFGCGKSGDNIKLYQKLTGIENFRESVEGLAGMFNIPIEYDNPQQQQQQRIIPLAKPKLTIATFDNPPDNVEVKISKIADDITEVKTIYRYSETQRVERIERYNANNNRIKFTLPHREKPDHKHLFPYHVDDNGNTIKKKGNKPWDFYRQNEAVEFGKNKWALMVEGENCVEALRALGIVGLSRMGSEKGEESVKRNFTALKNASVSGVVLIADNDRVGLEECKEFSEWASEVGLNTIVISTKDFWSEAPERGDIVDFIREHPETTQTELLKLLEGAIQSIQDAETSLRNSSKSTYQTSGTAALKPEPPSNVIPFKGQQQQLNTEDIEEKFKQLSEQTLSKSKLRLELNNIARECNANPKEIQNAYREYCEEIEDKESQADTKSDIEKIFENKNRQLDSSEYLSGNLSKITELSKRFGLRPELAISVFLSAVSGLQNVRSDIDLLDYTDFRQPLIVFNAIVAEPSQKKSPLIKKIVSEPLKVYQRELKEKYKQEMLEYESLPEEDKPKDKPILRQLSISGGSRAGLRDMLDKHAKHGWGVLIIADELAGNIKNKGTTYNIGLEEDELSYYEGDGKREALKDDMASTEEDVLLSIIGGIQPKVFSQFNDGSDFNGRWARYNLISQPLAPMIIPKNPGARIDLTPLLAGFYKAIATLPELHLRLSPEAKEAMRRLYNTCEMRRIEAKTQAVQALWGKAPGKIGRIAGLLHIIHQVESRGTVEDVVVSKKTLNLAAKLVRFYIGEAENLYGECSQDELAPKLVKIIELAEKRQTAISARDVKQFDWAFKKDSPDQVRGMFIQLAELGYGSTEGSGSRLKFSSNSSKKSQTVEDFANCRGTVEETVEGEIHQPQDFQPSVETVEENKKNNFETNHLHSSPLDDLTQYQTVEAQASPPTVEEVANSSTVSTNSYNPDEIGKNSSTVSSTNSSTVLNSSTVSGEHSPEPTPEPLPDDCRPTLAELTSAEPLPPLTHIACVGYVEPTPQPTPEPEPDTDDKIIDAIGIIIDELKSDENSEEDKLDLINSIRRTQEERERLRNLSPKIIERYPNDYQLLMDFCKAHPCIETKLS
ncbi:DUF3987 domain-containing protein [Planktothrix mougeotii]|uniref:DUF3987 domain-containing protein n=1 Tax=Planktothrix mougeotii LEGE 06226 TaxID=1828728 RepID=A0ABR9UEH8_9CYAN|nr:DUF3987 domain-containing protein [Planktothrix mougeotii]MBE9144875.1 DUF3987 domain-containing protein [Planktothrix mougeotii LEGE 06226]